MEQGVYELGPAEKANDACRKVNNEGWDVIQLSEYWDSQKQRAFRSLLLQREPLTAPGQ